MSIDETLTCGFQILKPVDNKSLEKIRRAPTPA